jgi:hypothetical protein
LGNGLGPSIGFGSNGADHRRIGKIFDFSLNASGTHLFRKSLMAATEPLIGGQAALPAMPQLLE